MKKIPIIIDCDPGHDDALAILWALGSKRFDIKAVTTVAGNQTIEKVTTNAVKILTKAKVLDIPVAKGAKRPLICDLEIGGTVVHGDSGLEGPSMPEEGFEISKMNAVDLMTQILENSEEKITLVPLGPLTNIAILFTHRPDLKGKIEKISLMGGGAKTGNWTPVAEYNIFADPEAAKIVFNAGVPIIMSGLDVTHKAFVTKEENEILRAQGNEMSVFAAELIDFFSKFHYEIEGFEGCTLHDPTAIAALIYPELFTYQDCNVDIEVDGTLTRGMTVVDVLNYKEKIYNIKTNKNVRVLFDVDRQEYVKKFFEAMKNV